MAGLIKTEPGSRSWVSCRGLHNLALMCTPSFLDHHVPLLLSFFQSFSKFSNTSHLLPLPPLSKCVLNSSLFAESWHSGFPVLIVCKWKAHISHAIFSTVLLNCNIEKKSVLFKSEEHIASLYLNRSFCYRSPQLFPGLKTSGTFFRSGVLGVVSVNLSINVSAFSSKLLFFV